MTVLDIRHPLISGVVVRQELAAHARARDIPVVIVGGSSLPHDELIVALPVETLQYPDALVATVKSCMASGASFSELRSTFTLTADGTSPFLARASPDVGRMRLSRRSRMPSTTISGTASTSLAPVWKFTMQARST